MVKRYSISMYNAYEMDESRIGEYVKYEDYRDLEESLNQQISESTLVGIAEIAELCHTSKQAVSNWRARPLGFPKPIAELRSGPIFHIKQIEEWLISRGYTQGD
jgi:hypothetical protein